MLRNRLTIAQPIVKRMILGKVVFLLGSLVVHREREEEVAR
jgi:hypothetical protein